MQYPQPLQTSSCTTTVPNSVRISAPVGQTSRQAACVQCLHTSDDISHRSPPSAPPLSAPPAGPDVAGERLGLLNVSVRIEADLDQIVDRVAGAVAGPPPVIGEPDLVQSPALDGQRAQPLGHQDAGLDHIAGGDDHRPAEVL